MKLAALALALVSLSAQEEQVVPVHQEPRHRQIFEAANTRVLDVQIPPGDTTLYHTHSDPILYVTMSTSRTRSQNRGAEWNAAAGASPSGGGPALIAPTDPPGRIFSVTTYAKTPQTHRVNNLGPALYRLIGITNSSPGDAAEEPGKGFDAQPELTNPWFRGYRLAIKKGQRLDHSHENPVAIVLAAGAVSLQSNAIGTKSHTVDAPGFVGYIDRSGRHGLEGLSDDTQVMEIEIRVPR